MIPQIMGNELITCENIEEIEQKMLTLPQAECPVSHKFGEGIYIRELSMKAGTLAIGHEQRFKHFNVFLKGKVLMRNEDGSTTILEAPMTFFADGGRKVGYVLEDMVWQNIYPNPENETDIESLETKWLIKSDSWKQHKSFIGDLKVLEHEVDRQDFKDALIEIGVSEEIVTEQSENKDDQISYLNNHTRTAESAIHGVGFFATIPIPANVIISPSRIGGLRTPAGRYTNHSANPNARMEGDEDGNIWLISIRDIEGCKGGELGEEITVDYRQAIKETLRIGGEPCQQ
jgi:hypothetical protein